MQERSEAERRAIWPCLNVATGTGRFGKKKFETFRQFFLPKRPPPCFCRNVFAETSGIFHAETSRLILVLFFLAEMTPTTNSLIFSVLFLISMGENAPQTDFVEYQPSSDDEDRMEDQTVPSVQRSSVFLQLQDPTAAEVTLPDKVEFEILKCGSIRKGDMLVSNDGFYYTMNRPSKAQKIQRKKTVHWRCTERSSRSYCKATAVQDGDDNKLGPSAHNHPPGLSKISKTIGYRCGRARGRKYVFESATTIAESTITNENLEPTSTGALAKAIDRARQRDRPGEPTDLLFELDMERVTNFIQADIRIRLKRHLIFATSGQLQLLNQALYWYVDGTFNIVRRPFEQLWIIHALIASGSKYKQEPLLYALMSRRRISDYTSVLKEVKKLLPEASPVEIVSDSKLRCGHLSETFNRMLE